MLYTLLVTVGDVLNANRGFQWNGVVCGMVRGMNVVTKVLQEAVRDVMSVDTLSGMKPVKNTKRSYLNGVEPIVTNVTFTNVYKKDGDNNKK